MDRFGGGGMPPQMPPQGGAPGGGGMTFAQYLGQKNPQLLQMIGQVAGQQGGGQPPMGGPPGMGGGMQPSVGGGMMGGGMPPQAQQMAMQDPMYMAGQAAARMMAARGMGAPPQMPGLGAPPQGMPPMGGGPPGMMPR